MALAADNKQASTEIQRTWKDYTNMEFFMESEDERRESDMREAFEYWRKVRPEVVKSKNGTLHIKGLL